MVTAVHGGRVWFGDREPLHVGFLPWWRVVDPPPGKGGKAPGGARSTEAGTIERELLGAKEVREWE